MKKKFKLFATVASISLTLALMVFGVIAATSVNVTISSNVSYTADGVAFKLYGKSEVLASQPSGDATDLTDDTADKVVTVGVTNAGTDNMTLPSQTFTASSTWVVYTFTVENIGSNLIEAITVSATASDENVLASADVPTGNLTQGAKETFRCYFHLKNANRSISQNGTSVTIEIGESIATEASYIAPGSLVGFSSVTEGATTTWTKGQESFAVTSSTSGTTVTETNTFTNGDKTTTFTTTYNTSTVQTAASQTFSNTLSNYVIADRTLRTINITSGDNTTVTIPDWLNITATYGYSSSTATFYNLRNSLQEVNLPNTLKTINNYTFHSCSLDSIEIPAGVTSIGGSSFASCANLALVSFAPGSQLNSIGSYAFRNCASLTSIAMLNDGLGTIDTSAFEGCSSLTSFDMPSQLTSLGNRAFKDCSALGSIVLPAALSSVGTEVFSGCQLSSVTFASSSQLTTISNDIFTGAEIESLEIPASVTSIGNSALANITGLTEVDIKSQTVANSLTSVGEAEGLLLCMAGLNLKFTGVTPPEFVTSNLTYNGSVYTVPNGTAVNVTNINIQPGEGLDALEESSSNSGSRFSFSTSAQCVAIYEIEWNWGSGNAYEEIEIAEGFETISGEEGSYSFSYFPKTFTDGSIRNPMSARGGNSC